MPCCPCLCCFFFGLKVVGYLLAGFVTALAFAFVFAETVLAIRYSDPPPEPGWIGATGKPGLQEGEYLPGYGPEAGEKYLARDVLDARTGVIADELDPAWVEAESARLEAEKRIRAKKGPEFEIED